MQKKKRNITILGSTGSIGVQTLQVLESLQNQFQIEYLTINSKIDVLEEQINKFHPKAVAIKNEEAFNKFKEQTSFKGKILCGEEGINEAAADGNNDLVLSALVGFAGVLPTLEALKQGTDVALANKETLVSAGSIIMEAANEFNADIIAVDSEHSAVLQCIVGESHDEIEKIILTASGGPFRETPLQNFKNITIDEALNHPNWSMGSKITIDSATLINKGFEVIEAFWLFNVDVKMIDVLIHPQSIVHSLVQFIDGSVKAQLGLPDMRIPISYALSFPERMHLDYPRLDLSVSSCLNFYKPDFNRAPCLKLAFEALDSGGTAPATLNAANEIAVDAFLKSKIRFVEIPICIEKALTRVSKIDNPSLNDIINIDNETRILTREIVNNFKIN